MENIDNLIKFEYPVLNNKDKGYLILCLLDEDVDESYYYEFTESTIIKAPKQSHINRVISLAKISSDKKLEAFKVFVNVVKIKIFKQKSLTIIDFSTIFPKLSHISCGKEYKEVIELNPYLSKLTITPKYNSTREDIYDLVRILTPYINNGLRVFIDAEMNEELFNNDLSNIDADEDANANADIYNKFKLNVQKSSNDHECFNYKYNMFTIAHMDIGIFKVKNKNEFSISDYPNVENLTLNFDVPRLNKINITNFSNLRLLHICYEGTIILNLINVPSTVVIVSNANITIN